MNNWRKVRQKTVKVSARGPISEDEIHEIYANKLEDESDYFVIDNGFIKYPIKSKIFYKKYHVPNNIEKIDGWIDVHKKDVTIQYCKPISSPKILLTMEGSVKADRGDFIIKSTEGKKYPIKPNEFDRLYDFID